MFILKLYSIFNALIAIGGLIVLFFHSLSIVPMLIAGFYLFFSIFGVVICHLINKTEIYISSNNKTK